jgi:hypothetical protein
MRTLFAAAALMSAAAVAAAEEKDGFVPLFNGTDLTGWEIKAGKPDAWFVKDGLLVCKGGGGGWVGTTKQYGDFVLKLEWRIGTNGNSGVFLRVPSAKGDPAFSGMEIQVLDDNGPHYKGKLKPWQYSGSVYAACVPSKSVFKGAGEWNTYEITCVGDKISIVFNGEKVVDIDVSQEPYTKDQNGHSALSKRPKKGFIGFQNHGSGVEYRNISIKPLDKE